MFPRWLALAAVLLAPAAAAAHTGPPFPILMDEKTGPYKVSVWAHPDVGVGTFYVFVEVIDGGSTQDVKVSVGVRPTSGRLPEAVYPAERQVAGRREPFFVEVEFDAEEPWQVRVQLEGPRGKGELSTEVEVTPPGLGRGDFFLYLFPFVLLAGLWAYGVVRHRNRPKQAKPSIPAGAAPPAPATP